MENNGVSEEFKRRLTEMLLQEADNDRLFAEKLDNEEKSIDECCKFILQEVMDSGYSGFADSEVLGMAKHYWDEKEVTKIFTGKCKVVINSHLELTEEEKKEAKEEAMRQLVNEEKERMRNRGRSQAQKKTETEQPNLFDL